ncbi:MAG: hypothetical protein ACM3IH_15890 [Sphingobacteriales bacterium]
MNLRNSRHSAHDFNPKSDRGYAAMYPPPFRCLVDGAALASPPGQQNSSFADEIRRGIDAVE